MHKFRSPHSINNSTVYITGPLNGMSCDDLYDLYIYNIMVYSCVDTFHYSIVGIIFINEKVEFLKAKKFSIYKRM